MMFDTLVRKYKSSSLLLRFIYINIAVFVIIRLVGLVTFIALGTGSIALQWVELPSDLHQLLVKPWTIVTYMFSHYGVLHILFNMLWLYWLGRIFLECFTPRQLGGLYVLGGLAGAALYLAAYNLIPALESQKGTLIGASASVMAIVIAISVYRPNYQIGLLFIGGISLKWIALVTVFIDLIGIESGNMGSHIAHLGGILMGLWFGLSIKRGHDITSWINRCIDALVSFFSKGNMKKNAWEPVGGKAFNRQQESKKKKNKETTKESNSAQPKKSQTVVDEERLDEILGKLKRSGYGALTDEEREFLFNASRKR